MRQQNIPPMRLSRGTFTDMYWTIAQMLTHHSNNWSPMTSIADAWEVVEHVYEMPLVNGAKHGLGLVRYSDGWYCQFRNFEKPITADQIDTAPAAICIAALRAKGVVE